MQFKVNISSSLSLDDDLDSKGLNHEVMHTEASAKDVNWSLNSANQLICTGSTQNDFTFTVRSERAT